MATPNKFNHEEYITMNTNFKQLNSQLPSWIDPDTEVINREKADLNAAYIDSWEQEGKPRYKHVLKQNGHQEEQKHIAQLLMEGMAGKSLLEGVRKIQQHIHVCLMHPNPTDFDTWYLEFDCTVAIVPYWLAREIGCRLRPAIELLTILSGNQEIKTEFETWLTEFMLKAEVIKKLHISLGRGFTRTTDVSAMMLPLVYDVRDELRRVVALAEKDEKLAGLFTNYEYFINKAFDA